ncbi:MAG: hypothetical protein R3F53_15720 [Gammaproteobacteria bacterium]
MPAHWTLTDVSCSSTGSSIISPIENGQSDPRLAPANEVICTFTNTFDDGDGIEPAQEDGVPEYNGSAQGDGNGDIADKLQANVSSVQNGSCWWTLESDGLTTPRRATGWCRRTRCRHCWCIHAIFWILRWSWHRRRAKLHVTLYFSPRNLSLVGVVKLTT